MYVTDRGLEAKWLSCGHLQQHLKQATFLKDGGGCSFIFKNLVLKLSPHYRVTILGTLSHSLSKPCFV